MTRATGVTNPQDAKKRLAERLETIAASLRGR